MTSFIPVNRYYQTIDSKVPSTQQEHFLIKMYKNNFNSCKNRKENI